MGKKLGYKKYCYWVDLHHFEKVKKNLEKEEIQLTDETRIPCRVLRPSIDIGYIAPPAWNSICKRRTSWYWQSEKSNKFLFVSSSSLDLLGFEHSIVIMESNFKPERLPTVEEMAQWVQLEEYLKRKPQEWDKPDPLEKKFYQRWFERHPMDEPFNFDNILRIHSANHANFLNPKYFVTVDGVNIPYSIADSIHTCSSCLEFFNIVGNQWTVKYVVPCIGAVQFAHLPMDKFFEVKIEKIM
jgi:hypothetical protein